MPLPGTGIILENPAAAPIPTAVAWGLTNLGLSTFSGVSPFYPQPPYGTAVDVPDCYFQIPNVQTLGVASYVIPPGIGYLFVTAATGGTLQLQVGTLATWVTIYTLAATTGYFYFSDGVNVRINATTSATFTLYPIRA
jgi:hypothetical protein